MPKRGAAQGVPHSCRGHAVAGRAQLGQGGHWRMGGAGWPGGAQPAAHPARLPAPHPAPRPPHLDVLRARVLARVALGVERIRHLLLPVLAVHDDCRAGWWGAWATGVNPGTEGGVAQCPDRTASQRGRAKPACQGTDQGAEVPLPPALASAVQALTAVQAGPAAQRRPAVLRAVPLESRRRISATQLAPSSSQAMSPAGGSR